MAMSEHSDVVDTSARAQCPYCGEDVTLELDPGGGVSQIYVQDCEVCCRPWRVEVRFRGATAEVVLRAEP